MSGGLQGLIESSACLIGGGPPQLPQMILHGPAGVRKGEIGPQIGQRFEDKQPAGHPGMGHGQPGMVDPTVAYEENIKIDRTGRIDRSDAGPALLPFPVLEPVEEIERVSRPVQNGHGVEKRRGAGRTADRGRFVERGHLQTGIEGPQPVESPLEQIEPVAQIGPESDNDLHGSDYLRPRMSNMS